MSFEADFLEMMPHEVSVERWLSEASDGEVTYASAGEPLTCYIRDAAKRWPWEGANESQSRRTIYFPGTYGLGAVTDKSRITLPVGFEPNVVFATQVQNRYDEGALHHIEVLT